MHSDRGSMNVHQRGNNHRGGRGRGDRGKRGGGFIDYGH